MLKTWLTRKLSHLIQWSNSIFAVKSKVSGQQKLKKSENYLVKILNIEFKNRNVEI